MNIEAIRDEALSLPPRQRAQLAEQLLASLDDLSEREIEQFWFQEAAHRAAEMDQGLARRIPADEVRREAFLIMGFPFVLSGVETRTSTSCWCASLSANGPILPK